MYDSNWTHLAVTAVCLQLGYNFKEVLCIQVEAKELPEAHATNHRQHASVFSNGFQVRDHRSESEWTGGSGGVEHASSTGTRT